MKNRVLITKLGKSYLGNDPEIKVKRTLQPTSRENATLEAERGETVVTNLNGQDTPEFFVIGGDRHSKGGTPLNLPENSFVFSRDKNMKIRSEAFLRFIGWKGSDSPTPADISKKFDLNAHKEVLANPFSDKLQRETANLMIRNKTLKLGALALYQESLKGFDSGIPLIAMPFIDSAGLSPEEFVPRENSSAIPLKTFQSGGENKKGRKVKIVGVPEQTATLSNQTTKSQNIPKGAVKWDPAQPGFKKEDVQPGDYIKESNGWYKVVGYEKAAYEGDGRDERLGSFNDDYFLLEEKFKDPEFSKGFIESYRKELAQTKPNKNLSASDLEAARKMTDAEVIDNFLYKLKQNFATGLAIQKLSQTSKQGDKKEDWDRNRELAKRAALDVGFDPLTNSQVASFQASYIGLKKLAEDPKFKDKLGEFALIQSGRGDESISGTMGNRGDGTGTISQVDGWDGDTTSGQLVVRAPFKMKKEEVEWQEKQMSGPQPVKHLPVQPRNDEVPMWWMQDINNIANAATDALTAKKYDPWQMTPEFQEANPTFTDFRGTAARIGSMTNAGARQASVFSNPGTYAAMFANMQSGAVDPILQAQEAENRANVGIANQFEQFNVGSRNQYNVMKAGLDTQLYDKQVMANEAFDNAKRAFRQNLISSFNNGWTNRGKTATMNKLFPDYSVDPMTGILNHDPSNRPITPIAPSENNDLADKAAAIMYQYPGMTWTDAIRLVKTTDETEVIKTPTGVTADMLNYPGQ